MKGFFLVISILCFVTFPHGEAQNDTTETPSSVSMDITTMMAGNMAGQDESNATTHAASHETSNIVDQESTTAVASNATVESATTAKSDDQTTEEKTSSKGKTGKTDSSDLNLQTLLSQLPPELRKLLLDRIPGIAAGNGQLKPLLDFAQSLLNNGQSLSPKSVQDLLQGLTSSSLFSNIKPGATMAPYTMSWPDCQLDILALLNGINSSQQWALNMLDASGKPGRSIFLGNLKFMGNYLQCNDVEYKDSSKYVQVDGRMCRAVIKPPFDIPGAAIIAGGQELKFYWDLCLPRSCEGSDLNNQLATYGLIQSAYIYCTPDLDMSDDTGAIVSLCVLAILGILLFLGTLMELGVQMDKKHDNKRPIYDAYVNASAFLNKGFELRETTFNIDSDRKVPEMKMNGKSEHEWSPNPKMENGNGVHIISNELPNDVNREEKKEKKPKDETVTLPKWQRALLAFSIPRNTKKILGVKGTPGSIGCLHGIRVLSMGWVILGHTLIFTWIFENPLSVFSRIKLMSFQTIINATLSVDSFFLMSGLLTGYMFMKECGKEGRVTLKHTILYYVHRYWRLTPPLMIWIMIVANIIKYVGEGRPLWTDYGGAEACRKNWWINMLYFNNVYKNEESCLGVTWFLSHDMQFYIVAPIALIPWVYGQRVIGFIGAGILICIHLVSSIWIEIDINADMLRNNTEYSQQIYFKPWTRVAPFAIGLIMGWVMWKTKCKVRMNKCVVIIGWLVSLSLILILTLLTYDQNRYEDMERFAEGWSHEWRTAWETMRRPLWAIALAWIILACNSGYGGPINSILSWEGWLPMSRLTYCAFLVHLTILMYEGLAPESTFMFTPTSVAYRFLGVVGVSYMVAFILAVCVEAPALALEKVVLS